MKPITLGALILCALSMNAQPGWLRNTAMKPDGSEIAFTYKGNIYTVPAAGGNARQITAQSYNTAPYYSPDGTKIAFTSYRNGSADVFMVDADGGTPVRLTTHSGTETVRGWLNDSTIIFEADIMPSRTDINGPFFRQTYTVGTKPGRRPVQLVSLPMTALSVRDDGAVLFENKKTYENIWRKHENSAGTPDIWMLDSNGNFTALQQAPTALRTPVWMGTDRYAFTSEEGGTLNVYSATLGDSVRTALTSFTEHPVRSLTGNATGNLLAFSFDGDIYTLVPGEQPEKINVTIAGDDYDADHVRRYISSGADNMAVNRKGDEVAFTVRGDLYVTSVKYETTRRITDTPGQERCMDFGPGGKVLVYDSERDGQWKLYLSRISDDARGFAYAPTVTEELLYSSDKAAQQPVFSPDGKKVAFLEDRTTLRIIDIDTKEVTTALDGQYNYSYSDGDISFTWSPDSKWLLADYIGIGGWNNTDIALVKADGTLVVDLTESGYSDSDPHWVLGGKGITYSTGRYGYRSHGSWGNEEDVMLMVLDSETWDKFNRTEEEAALAEEDEEEAEEETPAARPRRRRGAAPEPEPNPFDLDGRRYRTKRLTPRSSHMGDYFLAPKGEKLYYLARATEGGYKLYQHDLREDETSVLASGLRGGFVPDSVGENLFFLTSSGMKKLSLSDGDTEEIEFDAIYDRHPSLEREYIYDHAVSLIRDKFYDSDLHGIDWDAYAAHYRTFLPYINNRVDFAVLLSELLGELNASHTGASGGYSSAEMTTASLGAYFDPTYTGDGLLVQGIVPRGPLSTHQAGIQPGDIILAIDGDTISAGADYFPLLDDKADRRTRLTVQKADGSIKEVTVKPIEDQDALLYRAWVEHNQALVDSLSGGRLAYIHIEGMDAPSFGTAYDELLGKYRNREAAIVDTRYNGGGWLHNDVALLLSGRAYATFAPRGQYVGTEPYSQWTKPSVMLVNEANYSDAYGTPYTYQTLGIGNLVGAPVPGTMTAVWWEDQIDPYLVFGIPQVTTLGLDGKPLENRQLQPEIEVYNTPAETTTGNDLQIQAAVRALLNQLENSN